MSDKANAAHQLYRQMEAAKVLLAQFHDILGEDTDFRADLVEGQTHLLEAVERALARVIEVEANVDAIGTIVENLTARQRRLKEQRDNLRTSIAVALELAECRKLETPLATVSLKALPQKLEVSNEALIPAKYWKPMDPTLNKKALLAALKDKERIPGAELSNGGVSLMISPR